MKKIIKNGGQNLEDLFEVLQKEVKNKKGYQKVIDMYFDKKNYRFYINTKKRSLIQIVFEEKN